MAVSKYDTDVDLSRPSNSSHWHVADLVGSSKRVLDVGCSTGYFAQALAALGNDVVGVEYDAESAEVARSRGLEVLVADLEAVDLADHFGEDSFDVVVYADVLEHLRDPLPVLRRTRRLLRRGGTVVVSLPNVAHGDVRLALLDGRFDYTPTGILDDTHTRFFTRRTLTQFVRSGGFAVAELRRTTAGLFQTELGLDAAAADPAIVERLLADSEATTYQFVVKAVLDDAEASGIEHAEALYETRIERDRLVDEAARLRAEVVHLRELLGEAERDRQAHVEATELHASRAAQAHADLAQAREELTKVKGARRRLRQERDRLRSEARSR